ncbi:MAG: hypothetical protein IKS83_02710 [Victivallales bacterium]|nr:hypothetical protein [Victivallales bacterium]
MKSNFSRILVILGVMVALLCGLSFLQGRMNAVRAEYHLTDTKPLENAPPVVAFSSVALGGFRGLLADLLWLRVNRMQDEKKYYEMVQLADWIVKLQPRYTGAHAFLGWNMAYNISVTFTNFEDRWRWVKRGIELIRDEAMEYNPGDPELYRQLGWIYQHKMGKDMDDANRYYRVMFAREMIRLFADYYAEWEKLDKAPLNEPKLYATLGDKAEAFRQILAANNLDFNSFEILFREKAVIPEDSNGVNLRAAFDELGITETVELCMRHRWMLYKYRLDPVIMMECNQKYGDLDWRLPEAHAIYWAERGRRAYFEESQIFKRLNCDRMIFQSLNGAFQTGRLLYLKGEEVDIRTFEMTPNFAVADAADAYYKQVLRDYPDNRIIGPYTNFLVDGVVRLYIFGYKKKAARWFKEAKKVNPVRFPPDADLEEFVTKELAEDMREASQQAAQAGIQSYLFQAFYYLSYATDEESDEYKSYEALTLTAEQLYNHYLKFIGDTALRRGLPKFDEMRRVALGTVERKLRENKETMKRADNLAHFQMIPTDRFIPRAEEIEAPTVK